MFPWNIAKSAEAIFSRLAVKRLCKFALKKKLGQFLLGDIDLDQLDVQLGQGTIQLSDLALNVDFLNAKFGTTSSVIVKEGSIGSLLIRMPSWKGKGCEVEVDELEFVLAPCLGSDSSAEDATCNTSQDHNVASDSGKLQCDANEDAARSVSGDVHEGVKTIAKMVKGLLTSFNVRIRRVIVAFDPGSKEDINNNKSLVFRIAEVECGTCVSSDGNSNTDDRVESCLGTGRLAFFVNFQGALLELLEMENIDKQAGFPCVLESASVEMFSHCPQSSATIPVMTGTVDGFSGNVNFSIPWKNGSLDIRRVDADVCIDPIQLKLYPTTIKWFLLSRYLLENPDKNGRLYSNNKSADCGDFGSTSQCFSPEPSDERTSRDLAPDLSSLILEESETEGLLPGSHLISDWVPFSVKPMGKDGIQEELEFGSSVEHFFECLDGMRSSQYTLGGSGVWNWTCSVFSAITAASSLASGSLRIPPEQQHVETSLNISFSGISVFLFFHDENQNLFSGPKHDQIDSGSGINFVETQFSEIVVFVQVCPQEVKCEGTIKRIEISDYFSSKDNDVVSGTQDCTVIGQSLLIQHLQNMVQSSLPPLSEYSGEQDLEELNLLASTELPFGQSLNVAKASLLKTSGITQFQLNMTSSSTEGSSTVSKSTSLSLRLSPLVLWVNFVLIRMLLDLFKEIEVSVERSGKRTELLSGVHDEYESSEQEVERCSPPVVTSQSTGSLCVDILISETRVILCFPFECCRGSRGYSSWDQFVALCSSLPPTMSNQDTGTQRKYPSATSSLNLNIGDVNVFLVASSSKDIPEYNSQQSQRFHAQNLLCLTNRKDCPSVISVLWQDGQATGPWIAKRAKSLATLEESRSQHKFVGKDSEFASVSTVKDLEDLYSLYRQDILLSSNFFLHVRLPPVTVNLDSSQYKGLNCLMNQVTEGLSSMPCEAADGKKGSSVSQTSILIDCDSLEISVRPDKRENIKGNIQSELPGSWCSMRLKVQGFKLLSVSNIGGIRDAKFVWLAHDEGKLFGSITGAPDQEFVLISCSNSTIKRGNGEGSNVLSSRLAGTDIAHLWDAESCLGYTSINVRCGTIVAIGGRLDWIDTISSFFSSPFVEGKQDVDKSLPKERENESSGASFVLSLVDVGLSYEPYLADLGIRAEILDSSNVKQGFCEDYVACLLAASSLTLTNSSLPDAVEDCYRIRIQDIGLLLQMSSNSENIGGIYSVDHLYQNHYVKVAGEALIEAIFRTNCRNGLLWELEFSKSHICMETCHDTTTGLLRLVAQLQQLFSPDLDESLVHLQTRWNNVQQAMERKQLIAEQSSSDVHAQGARKQNEDGRFGLMDEICEDVFLSDNTSSCESPGCVSLDEVRPVEVCELNSETYNDLSFNGSVPVPGLEYRQTLNEKKDRFPEFIESYCLAEFYHVPDMSHSSQFHPETSTMRDVGNGDLGGNNGWYSDMSLKIVENHISEAGDTFVKHYVEDTTYSSDSKAPDDFAKAIGRVLLKHINVTWKMYAGSDWNISTENVEQPSHKRRRDTDYCLELALTGVKFQYDVFPDGGICVSKLCLSVKDFHLYDNSVDAPWKMVLGYYNSKNHPRESSSKAFKMDLEAFRPDPSTPLEEYRLRVAFLPMILHLHQSQLDFLISFFGGNSSSEDQSPTETQDSDNSKSFPTTSSKLGGLSVIEEALLPYFQKIDVWPILVRVDYSPSRVDLAALRGGKYVELVNLVPWKGIELQLKRVQAVGIYGWNSVCETVVGDWLEDISQNQIRKILEGLPPVRSLVAVSSGASKLVSLPFHNYRKDQRVLKGMQRGTIAFLRSISLEAVELGVHLAAGAHDILLQAEYILTSIPPTVRRKTRTNVRSNQPRDAQEGIQQAYESLSDGLGKSASALVRTPLKRYQRGAGAGSAIATAVRAIPAAAIAPASACVGAVHCALLGVRNSLDPDRKKESMEKYLGPNDSREQN